MVECWGVLLCYVALRESRPRCRYLPTHPSSLFLAMDDMKQRMRKGLLGEAVLDATPRAVRN